MILVGNDDPPFKGIYFLYSYDFPFLCFWYISTMPYEIHTLDLLYQDTPETIGSYLILGQSAPILIETGPASTLSNLKQALKPFNLKLSDIKHVFLTHIHLDHSGAAGWLANEGAQLYVHSVGAPHLIDPTKLLASAGRIYVGQMDKLWGETIAAPEDKVTAVTDDQIILIDDLEFRAIDTPGHAWHHMAYLLDEHLFCGDSVGNRLSNRPYTVLPAPPPEFKLDVWQKTIKKIQALKPSLLYPTHFGVCTDPATHLEQFSQLLDEASQLVLEQLKLGKEREEIIEIYQAYDIARGKKAGLSDGELAQYIVSNPLHMSVDGITRYWKRKGTV